MIFKDLYILELASVLAGPSVGMFFAELGARVIKIENKRTGGDVTRQWKLEEEDPEASISAYYASINWQKEVYFLDLREESARQRVYDHIRKADVVISSFRRGTDEKLGMAYHQVRKLNPSLIYASVSGFAGESKRPAFDVVLQAESGFMSMNGEEGRPPVKMPVALIDVLAAHQLKEAVLLALLRREKTGKGAEVSVSLYEAAVASLANQASNYLMAGHIPRPMGSLHPNIAPYGESFLTADNRRIVLAIGNDQQFRALCRILGEPELPSDARFASNSERVRNRGDLYQILQGPIGRLGRDELMKAFEEQAVAAGAILDLNEVFTNETARQMILEERMDGTASKRVKTVAFKLDFTDMD